MLALLTLPTPSALLHGLQPIRRLSARSTSCCASEAAPVLQPAEVVEAQLRALRQGEAGLGACHEYMSPAYHQRSDARERFVAWFDSPVYESLLGCCAWTIRGAVVTREEMCETPLPDGRTFLGSAPVEQALRVEVTPGRAKWAATGVTGAKIGRSLPPSTYEWTLSLQKDSGRWTVDRIVPEATMRVPASMAAPMPEAASSSTAAPPRTPLAVEEEPAGGGLAEGAVALVAAAALLTVGRWLGDETGVFGASLDPAYWGDAPARATLDNLLD